MGRYYFGDIKGKFWFAVQESNAADQFGYYGTYNRRTTMVTYRFTVKHLPTIDARVDELTAMLDENDNLTKLDKFFAENNGYNPEMIMEALNVSKSMAGALIAAYADYRLGLKIQTCVKERGACRFEGEC